MDAVCLRGLASLRRVALWVPARACTCARARDRVNAAARRRRSRKILGRGKFFVRQKFLPPLPTLFVTVALISFGGVFFSFVTVNW